MKRTLTMLCAGMLGVTSYVAPAVAAASTPRTVDGHFEVFSRSIGNPDLRGPASFEIDVQHGPSFSGEVCLPPGPCVPVSGVISERGDVRMAGRGLTLHAQEFGERPGIRPSLLVGEYDFHAASGGQDHGEFVAVHQAFDGGGFAGGGGWRGEAQGLGIPDTQPVALSLAQDRVGRLSGRATWGRRDPPSDHDPPSDRTFDVAGQTFVSSGDSGMLLIGAADDALFVADLHAENRSGGGLSGPAKLRVYGANGIIIVNNHIDLLPDIQPSPGADGS